MGSCVSSHSEKRTSSPSSRPYEKPYSDRNNSLRKSKRSSQTDETLASNPLSNREIQIERVFAYNSSGSHYELVNIVEPTVGTPLMDRASGGDSAASSTSVKRRSLLPKFGSSGKVAPHRLSREIATNIGDGDVVPGGHNGGLKKPNETSRMLMPKQVKSGITKFGSVVDPEISSSSSSVSSGLSHSSYSTKSSASSVLALKPHHKSQVSVGRMRPPSTSLSSSLPPSQHYGVATNVRPNNQEQHTAPRSQASLPKPFDANKNVTRAIGGDARNGNKLATVRDSGVSGSGAERSSRSSLSSQREAFLVGAPVTGSTVVAKCTNTRMTTHITGLPKPQTAQVITTTAPVRRPERFDASLPTSTAAYLQQQRQYQHHVQSTVTSARGYPSGNLQRPQLQRLPQPQRAQNSAAPPTLTQQPQLPPYRPPSFGFGLKENCPYRRPGASQFASKPSVPSVTSPVKDISRSPIGNGSVGVPIEPVTSQTKDITTINSITSPRENSTNGSVDARIGAPVSDRTISSLSSDRSRFDPICNSTRPREPIPKPIQLTQIRRPYCEATTSPLSSITSTTSTTSTSSSNSILPNSYEQLKTCRGFRPPREKSVSLSSGESTPHLMSPEKGNSPQRQSSTSSASGNGDFLIDDEICDQPELVLSSSLDEVDKTLKQSLSALENLKLPLSHVTSPTESNSLVSSITSAMSNNNCVSPTSPCTPTNGTSTRFRKPRALSLIESADGSFGFDGSSYRSLVQDMNGVKTLLFRLQGLLQNAETLNPFDHANRNSYSSFSEEQFNGNGFDGDESSHSINAVQQENLDLKRQIVLFQQQMEDRDKTIKLLQNQMTKYLNISDASSEPLRPEKSCAATQTERSCRSSAASQGISARNLSDGSNGMLVSPCDTYCDRCEELLIFGESEC